MYITSITHILQQLHVLHTHYTCIILFTSVVKNDLLYNLVAANLFNVHEDVRSRPSPWFVACFLPSLGPESKWDELGGNSNSVRNTELMMECNDCLRRKLAQQIEREKEEQPLAKETMAALAEKNRPTSQKDIPLLAGANTVMFIQVDSSQ